MKNQSLGRGLNSLIPPKTDRDFPAKDYVSEEKKGEALEIFVSEIRPNPMQPRHEFDPRELEDLIESVKEHGIIQPLVVSQSGEHYQLIAGERRLRAAQFLSLEKVPVVVRHGGEQDWLEIALIENIQRKDLNPIEKARGYRRLADEFGLTQEQVSGKMGKSRVAIANAVRLLDLPEEIIGALAEGKISEGHAKAILSLENHEERIRAFRKIIENNFSVRETEFQVRRLKARGPRNTGEKSFDLKEKEDRLRKALGTKVTIVRKGAGGKITAEFYSEEELKGIVDKICGE